MFSKNIIYLFACVFVIFVHMCTHASVHAETRKWHRVFSSYHFLPIPLSKGLSLNLGHTFFWTSWKTASPSDPLAIVPSQSCDYRCVRDAQLVKWMLESELLSS